VTVSKEARVVSCYSSFAECGLLSGGELVGVTADAIEEHSLPLPENIAIIGSVKEVNLEAIIALEPDFVILSADLTAHMNLTQALDEVGITYGCFRIDTFEDYASLMAQFCAVNERPDLYEKNVEAVSAAISELREKIPASTDKTVLLIRIYSTGIKAKTDDNLAGIILKEFGLTNIADATPSLLEEMSLEHIAIADPDYIFALTMGSEASAAAYMSENIESNRLWSSLSAVKGGRYHLLPKDLFHYKPNDRWNESYEYIAKIVFPEVFE
jgi:iron complex transport system substrate-binding protein